MPKTSHRRKLLSPSNFTSPGIARRCSKYKSHIELTQSIRFSLIQQFDLFTNMNVFKMLGPCNCFKPCPFGNNLFFMTCNGHQLWTQTISFPTWGIFKSNLMFIQYHNRMARYSLLQTILPHGFHNNNLKPAVDRQV